MINASRRSFLGGLLALTAVTATGIPAFAAIPTLWGDGVHDDTEALNALFSGTPVKVEGENIVASEAVLKGGVFLISDTIFLRANRSVIDGVVLNLSGSFKRVPAISFDYKAGQVWISNITIKGHSPGAQARLRATQIT